MTYPRTPLTSLWLAIAVTFILSPAPTLATENDAGIWAIFTTTDAFQSGNEASRWHYWFDAQGRYFDIGSGINQWLLRPGIGYRLNDDVKVWLGYARIRSRNRAGDVADENRYWQQIDWAAGRWMGGSWSLRARLEQRSVGVGDDLGIVLRTMAKYTRPMSADGKTSLILALEPFVALTDTDWGGDAGLTQNRATIGLGWRLSDSLTIEGGYMNQHIWVDGAENRINHLGVVNFKVKF